MDENQNNPNQPKAPAEIPVDPPPPEPPPPAPNRADSLPPIPQDPPPIDPPAIDPPADPPPLTPPGIDPRANSLPQIEKAPAALSTPPPQPESKKGGSFKKFFVFAFVILLFAIGTASVSGNIVLGTLAGASATHVCRDANNTLSSCSSAAEWAPALPENELEEGDIVVTSGNFLVDSESKLRSATQ